jgi:hypothetical protein
MKNLFIIFTVLFSLQYYPQSYYKDLFDSQGYDTSIGYSTSANQLEFSWGICSYGSIGTDV